MERGRYVITPDEVVARIDENTIGAIAILGTTYTGEFEPIKEIHVAVVANNEENDLQVPAQLIGTVWFDISTFSALRELSTRQEEALVWAPDAFGSICFLVASGLALIEICNKLWCWKPKLITWKIAAINMVGSVAFGISAIGAFVLPETGNLNNTTVANSFTFIPAISATRNQSSTT